MGIGPLTESLSLASMESLKTIFVLSFQEEDDILQATSQSFQTSLTSQLSNYQA
jgi:hypothetical protein